MKKENRIIMEKGVIVVKRARCLVLVLVPLVLCLLQISCSTVPKEVVELSYRMGGDLAAVQKSYMRLIHDHFESIRAERIRYLNEEWTPKYIKTWVQDGLLRDVAKGDVVWSEKIGEFVKPIAGKEEEGLLETVGFWSLTAVKEIEGKKKDILEPLNQQEEQLSSWVSDAFNRLYRSNAAITAHLNSLRKVQEVQDEALTSLHLKDLRDKINDGLATASERAKDGLETIRKADGLVQEAKKRPQKNPSIK
jgi:hypothetical protein